MRHTPGPWTAKGAVILCPRGQVVASCEHTTVPTAEQRRVNACLLAAAPELLASLKDALIFAQYSGGPVAKDLADSFREVIAKAEGEE